MDYVDSYVAYMPKLKVCNVELNFLYFYDLIYYFV